MPVIIIPRLILGLLSWAVLVAAIYLLWSWGHGYDVIDGHGVAYHVHGSVWRLYTGGALLAWSFLGRSLVLMLLPRGKDEPREQRGEGLMVQAPDGSALRIDSFGRVDAPTVVLTHGWGLNSTAWWYTRKTLAQRFRVVTWDLPGLGRSKAPRGGKFTIDGFAQALGAVVEAAGPAPIVLVGHSIGGMTTQTFWRACPEAVRQRVAGVVLVDTTHEDPLRTMWASPLWKALRWPLIEPILWLTIALSPLAWLSSWQGYLSGSNQLAMRLTGFGRHATRGQVDFTARLACKGSPGAQARGNLAMFRWSATEALASIPVPMLVLAGSKDIVTLPRASQTIANLAPRARFVEVEGAGHMGFMERSVAYDREIAGFIDGVFGPDAAKATAGFATSQQQAPNRVAAKALSRIKL
jgi:pimeloyl-ACP methyl ester carboxylesterase